MRRPADIRPGDQIAFSAGGLAVELAVQVAVSSTPVPAAPDAIYAAVGLDLSAPAAETTLFPSAPMPNIVEFADLLNDLAAERVHRIALFVWRAAQTKRLMQLAIVKFDGISGGRVPDGIGDFLPILD